jgi:hypothetical protein
MKAIIVLFFMLLMLSGCRSGAIKYENDIGFLNSAQANSMEFPIKIKGKVCLDLEGITGLCSTRIDSNQDFTMSIDPQSYSYRYKLTCSREINADQSSDVMANVPMKIIVPKANIVGIKSFICIGEIFPADRPQELSAKWEVRVKVQDVKYQKRESIYETTSGKDKIMVIGRNALYTRVCYAEECRSYTKQTSIKKEDKVGLSIYSESYNMRYNFYKE